MHFKNRFRVDIRLSGTCFHLNIKIQAAFFRVETIGAVFLWNIPLQGLDILPKLLIVQ